ncbi:MAG: peptide chain release factor N(5)-glutamine methyltransferase [Betaproteobacteria bacterium]
MQQPVNSNPESSALATLGALLLDNALPRLEASLLLAHVLGCERVSVLAHPERELTAAEALRFAELRCRRLEGEPIAYLTGWREFYGLRLMVTSAVLIPRPETEGLVAAALERMPLHGACRVLDLGTGSGAAAIAIAKERPCARVHAIDVSEAAVALAHRNARAHGATNMTCQVSDWYSACAGIYDVIVSNPPYIDEGDSHLDLGDLRFEPGLALISGSDGLEAIRKIVAQSRAHLAPGGWLMLEHGFNQGAQCRQLMLASGLVTITTRPDMAGIERISCGRAPP